ncbi:MAG: hypothetical protein VX848_05580 [Verrucomicrobiota bacterium]|nr:hypothetical protein [Verrucomicrobiota bacterium]
MSTSNKNLHKLISNFLSETKYPSELERVYYSKNRNSDEVNPTSSDYSLAESFSILNMSLSKLSKHDPDFITRLEAWICKKKNDIDHLRSKLRDTNLSTTHQKTISDVLKELEKSLGIS